MLCQMEPLPLSSYAPVYLRGQPHQLAGQHHHHAGRPSLHQQVITLSDMPPLMLTDDALPPLYLVCGAGGKLAMSPTSATPDGTPVKICAVCGDRALSCNFGAITCESCKAFFRRNATRIQEMYSRCDERCVISVQSRSHCKHCRLLKCFAVGMRPELILTEEQKRERRIKIAENRQRRLLSGSTVLVSSGEHDSASASPPYDGAYAYDLACGKVARWDMDGYRQLPALVDVRGSLGTGQRSSPPSQQLQLSPPPIGHGELTRRPSESASGSSMDDDVILVSRHASDRYEHHLHPSLKPAMLHAQQTPDEVLPAKRQRLDGDAQRPVTSFPSSSSSPPVTGHSITQDADLQCVAQMSDQRAAMVYNLTHAFRQSFDQPVAQTQSLKSEGSTVDFLNMADLTIRRLVKMARYLPHFRTLSQQHQIDLLKGCVIDVLLLRSIKNFDLSRQGWMTQTREQKQFVSASAFKADPAVGANYYRNYAAAAMALQEANKKDSVVLMLLIVLSLFNPKYLGQNDEGQPSQGPGQLAAAVQAVQVSRAAYVDVMKEYLGVKYGDADGLMYLNIAQKLDDFLVLGSFHNELLKQTDACDLEPLVVEMFDLS